MQELTALYELDEYIAKNCDNDIIGNICKPLKRCDSYERVCLHFSVKEFNSATMSEFLGRLKQREVSRRRQHRNLRWDFNHDYVTDLIDLFDVSYEEDDNRPPPPPPYLPDQTIVTAAPETGNFCRRSYSDRSLVNEGHAILEASIDPDFIVSSASLLAQSDSAFSDGTDGNLLLAISRGRRLRSRNILTLKLNASVGDNTY